MTRSHNRRFSTMHGKAGIFTKSQLHYVSKPNHKTSISFQMKLVLAKKNTRKPCVKFGFRVLINSRKPGGLKSNFGLIGM